MAQIITQKRIPSSEQPQDLGGPQPGLCAS